MTFTGKTLHYSYRFPDLSGPNSSHPNTDFIVGPGIEITAYYYNIDVSSNEIYITFNQDNGWLNATFNGPLFEDLLDNIKKISNVTLDTNMAGLDPSEVTFDENTIKVDWQGTSFSTASYVRLTVTFADPPAKPEPVLISGTSGADFLKGTDGADRVDGGAGNDSIFAGHGDDIVNGGAGDDVIGGGTGADILRGDAGNDTFFGGNGNDFIYGGDGNDVAWSGRGADMIRGDTGDDVLGGGLGRDAIYGGDGDDTIYGGGDNDWLYGDAGNDTLYGGEGDDRLIGGAGNDVLWGGAGADTFIFGKNEGNDVIGGFNAKDGDRIDIGSQTYTVSENEKGSAVLELSGGGTITLNGIGLADVNADWFL